VPPASAFTFEGNKTREHIRSQLPEVRYVLDGIVGVGAGDSVRITAELEDLGNGELLWDDDYQTRVDNTNFFTVQSEIAASVSDSLQVVVLEDEQRALAELPTKNLEAYEAYVAGLQQTDLLTRDSLQRAVGWFDEAVALDPQFVGAYIARANANRLLMTYFEPPIEMLPKVVDSISTALELDPDSAEARSSLGLAYVHAWRWEDAWLMLNEAKKRDPNLALTEIGFAIYYSGLGDADGVKRALAAANRLDPLNIEIADWGQWALAMVGEADAAMSWAQEKMRQHPEVGVVYTGGAVAASLAGDHERAIELAARGARLDGNSPISLITLAQVYGAAGQTNKVLPLLEEAGRSGEYMCPYESAVAWLPLGETDKVFDLLDDAIDYRSNCLIFLRSDPRMEPIRDDPRYETLLTRVGLDDIALSRYRK
jgi:tetratricopeptide (TPR) repeat protein